MRSMDTARRTFLMLAAAGALWCWSGAGAQPTPAEDVLHVTMDVQGMH